MHFICHSPAKLLTTIASYIEEREQELQALEERRLTPLKAKRLALRAQRIASGVCALPISRLERVLKVLRTVRKSQKVTLSDHSQIPLFSQTSDIKSVLSRMPPRHLRKQSTNQPSHPETANANTGESATTVKENPEEQMLETHLIRPAGSCSQSDHGVPVVPKGRWTGLPPLIRRVQPKAPQPALFTPSTPSSPFIASQNPPRPSPSANYTSKSLFPPVRLSSPQPLLLVLDLNGTLVYRKKGTSTGIRRPSLKSFLNHCLTQHKILIWSSARPENVQPLCRTLFSPPGRYKKLVGVWGRDTLGLSNAQYQQKVQVYKDLEVVWRDDGVQASHPGYDHGGRWHQGNTLLLDDSQEKARAQPHNLVEVPAYLKTTGQEEGQEVLAQVMGWIEEARWYEDVSSVGRTKPFKINTCWTWDWKTGAPHKKAIETDGKTPTKIHEHDNAQDLEEDGGVVLGMNQLSVN